MSAQGAKKFRSGMVAVVGRPNVGKSTLMNQVMQEKVAIVSDTPQTTRHRILGVRTLPDAQLVLLDTPGIHKPRFRLNRRMVQAALEAIQGADVVLFMVEAVQEPGPGDRYVLEAVRKAKLPTLLVINKIDRVKKERLLPLMDHFSKEFDFAELVPISALKGDNVDRLVQAIVSHLPQGEPLFPEETLTDQSMRSLAAELIREKVLQRTRDELPYAIAVAIEAFVEEEDRKITTIKAVILVERESQKKIVIGEKGRMLKDIGRAARLELERMLDRKVYLELWVKVKKNWRQNDRFIKELGY